MKPFNLEEYLKNPNKKVVTRDGRDARIICTDRVNFDSPVMALVMAKSGIENVYSYRTNGQLFQTEFSDQDLFFVSEKHEGWLNVYRHIDTEEVTFGAILHTSREKAEEVGRANCHYVATAKIEWEE